MEEHETNLKDLKICRFCLDDTGPFTNIYEKDANQTVPLQIQLMACVSIEVFANDGFPQFICKTCKYQINQAYNFKTVCKRSDDALKLCLVTGTLVKPALSRNNESKKRFLASAQAQENPRKIFKINDASLTSVTSTSDKNNDPISVNQLHEDQEVTAVEHTTGNQECQNTEVQDEEREYLPSKIPQVRTDVFPCPHCERSFPLQQLLELHVKNHDRERKFECEECERRFFTKYDLGKHLLTHVDCKPYSCVVCRKQFSRESLLHRHEKIHVQAPKYLCTECDRTFLTSDDLDAHMERHKKRRPFACRLCNKRFVFKQGLERHELSHSDQKPHKCNYCEASFTSPIKLTRHITSHAGLRPYPCKLCGRTFLLSHHLTRHMRSHYAAKSPHAQPIGQHKCDMCSMSFRRKDSLINHSAIHSMVNLKCAICSTEFENAKMVKDHIATHLSGLPYPCDKCDYSFDTQDQLEEHELKHAEMEYEEQIEKEVTEEVMNQNSSGQRSISEGDDGEEVYSGDDDDDDDDVAEFSITNPNNLEIVRRSKRERKIKNFAEFLKDELGSDIEDDGSQEAPNTAEDDEDDLLYKPSPPSTPTDETIKPVVRTEGTKVYCRKNVPERPERKFDSLPALVSSSSLQSLPELQTSQVDQISQLPILENINLDKDPTSAFPPNKNYVDMKIGNKLVRVQKLVMSKAEIQQMAKEGKIEMKGNTILLKKKQPLLQSRQNITIDSIFREAVSTVDSPKQQNHSSQEELIQKNNESFSQETQGVDSEGID